MNSTILEFLIELPRADPGTEQYPLLASPVPMTLIVLSYLLIVLKLGPMYMKNREPYNVNTIMMIYNICQVIYNGVIFALSVYYLLIERIYDLWCMETLAQDNPTKHMERFITYIYFINKILDLMDTLFFVLRKSFKQITTLHVYHHVIMVYCNYWVIRLYGPGGQYSILGLCNAFVHAIMYFYYFVTSMRPELKAGLWWKKYITIIQIVQFVIYLIQSALVLAFNSSCSFPLVLQFQQILQSVTMIVMFSNFYYKAYVKPKSKLQ